MCREIDALGGAVPFDRYMELALYHPQHGYYSADRSRYGRDGDYLTAPTASEWYPRVVARLLSRLVRRCGPLRMVDVAAGDGSLLAGLMEALEPGSNELLSEVVAVERSPAMRQRQTERFGAAPVRCNADLISVAANASPTVVHASELFDAQPVVRVVGRGGELNELWVTVNDGSLGWQERPARDSVEAYFARHGVELADDQIAEANLAATDLHRRVLRTAAGAGLCLVLDYGYEARRLFNPRGRRGGSLATFAGHQVGRDPLQAPGRIDLTAHVNWDDLRQAGAEEDWTELGLWPLAEFLVRAGIADELEERGFGIEAELDAATVTARQEVKRLLDPEGMGSDLKMLVQARGELIDAAASALSLDL